MSKKLNGKIGYCDNRSLRLKDKRGRYLTGGHYVYIREDNKNGTCNVNIITSLEQSKEQYVPNKMRQVRKGQTYLIPYYDANFSKLSGIKLNSSIVVPTKNLRNIGTKRIKQKHQFFVGKFGK